MGDTTTESEATEPLDRESLLKALFGFLVAGVVIYYFGTRIGWGEIFAIIRGADYRWVAVACASTTLSLVIWSKAWDVLLSVVDVDIPFPKLSVTYIAATFADYMTPFGRAGGGPFVAYVLSRDERASFEDSLASIVTSDALNLVPFFTFAAVGFLALVFTGEFPSGARTLLWGLGALFVVLPLLAYLFWTRREAVERLADWVISPVARRTDRIDPHGIRDRVDEFYGLVDRMAVDRRAIAKTLGFAFVGWIFFALPLYFAALTLGVHLSPLVVLFVVPASTVAGFVPTPGGLGGVEAAIVGLVVALTALGPETAAALALVYRVASFVYVLVLGGGAMLYLVSRS
jgi:uncharacterized protein (TIRG00374 family)